MKSIFQYELPADRRAKVIMKGTRVRYRGVNNEMTSGVVFCGPYKHTDCEYVDRVLAGYKTGPYHIVRKGNNYYSVLNSELRIA